MALYPREPQIKGYQQTQYMSMVVLLMVCIDGVDKDVAQSE